MKRGYDYSLNRHCPCGKAVTNRSESGLCRVCFNRSVSSDPAVRAKKSASAKRYANDPANRQAISERGRRSAQTRMADPAYAEALRKQIKKAQAASLASPTATESRRRAAYASAAKRKAWCPEGYWGDYAHLVYTKGMRSTEAKAIVLAKARHDREQAQRQTAAKREALSPFERQERALQRGAKLIANDAGPRFGEGADYGEARWELGRVG